MNTDLPRTSESEREDKMVCCFTLKLVANLNVVKSTRVSAKSFTLKSEIFL